MKKVIVAAVVVTLLGLAAICAGVAMVSVPAGLIVGGIEAVTAAYVGTYMAARART